MKKDVISTKECQCISFLFMLALWLVGIPVKAQDVTISPSTGKLIAGATSGSEVGFENGGSSTWRHNQLPLSLYVSDAATLTESGSLQEPAGDLMLDKSQDLYVLTGGESVRTHINISLPNGYRFTGYKIVLINNLDGKTVKGYYREKVGKQFFETDEKFNHDEGQYIEASSYMTAADGKEYSISRTSKTADDMGNNIYFYLDEDKNGFYAVTIKSIELWFTAATSFTVDGTPETSAISSDGKNIVAAPFKTGKLDLGKITN